jgi:hypothetical protein
MNDFYQSKCMISNYSMSIIKLEHCIGNGSETFISAKFTKKYYDFDSQCIPWLPYIWFVPGHYTDPIFIAYFLRLRDT